MSSNKPVIREVFIAPDGGLRSIWRLVAAVTGWYLISLLSMYALGSLMVRLFDTWGVTARNLAYCPRWIQYLVMYQTTIYHSIAAMIAAVIAGMLHKNADSALHCLLKILLGSAVSISTVLLLAGMFILTDSMRSYTYSAGFSMETLISLLVCAVTGLAEGLLAFGYIRQTLTRRGNRLTGYLGGCVMFIVMDGFSTPAPFGILNLALMGLMLCYLAERVGAWSVIGLRAGWLFATSALVGFNGNEAALIRLYPVSEDLLTGGNYGPMNGSMVTLICILVIWPVIIWPIISKIWRSMKAARHTENRT